MADLVPTIKITPAPVDLKVVPAKPWGLWRALTILLPLWTSLSLLSAVRPLLSHVLSSSAITDFTLQIQHLHYTLPTPKTSPYAADGLTPQFDESAAMRYIVDMAMYADGTPRYRIVGTEEMVLTEQYLLGVLERIKEQVDRTTAAGHEIEIWHQVSTPWFPLRFAGG